MALTTFCLAQSNQVKTPGVSYSAGAPNWTPAVNTASEIAIDTVSKRVYFWNRKARIWDLQGRGVDQTSGSTAPAYTPSQTDSYVAVNNANPPEIYVWSGSAWLKAGGVTYSAGTGIAISGSNVISNTGDLSTTNELQTLSVATNTATLSNSGGSVTIAGGGINSVSTSGTTITVTGNEGDGSTSNELNTGFDVSGGNLRIIDPGATRTVPVTTIAPDQSVTNEIQAIDTLRVNGANLELSLSSDLQPAKTLAVSSIAPIQALANGTGISISGTITKTITNSAPDQTVAITGAGSVAVSGTYPSFTVTGNGISALTGDVTATGPGSAASTIAAGVVTAAKLATGAVGDSSKVAAAAITTTRIADGAIWAVDIAANAVTAAKIANSAVTSAKLASGAVSDSTKMGTNVIEQSNIDNQSVWARHLARMGASSGQVLKWDGYIWAPAIDGGLSGSGVDGQISYWASGTIAGSSNFTWDGAKIGLSGQLKFSSPSDGRWLLQNNASTDFERFQAGGTTSSFPALQFSSAQTVTLTFTNGSADIATTANTFKAGDIVRLTQSGQPLPVNFYTLTDYFVQSTNLSSTNIQLARGPFMASITAGAITAGGTYTAVRQVSVAARLADNSAGSNLTVGRTFVKDFLQVENSTLNRSVRLTEDALFGSRTVDGGYAGSIQFGTGADITVNTRSNTTFNINGSNVARFNDGVGVASEGILQVGGSNNNGLVGSTASSGTTNGIALNIRPLINNTGTYSGKYTGIYYNPNTTSLTGTDHRAIETLVGDVRFGSTNGNVGIGMATGSALPSRFYTQGSGATSSTWTAQFHNSSGTNNAFVIRDDGFIGIRTNAPTDLLDVNGTNGYTQLRLRSTYTPTSSSDTNGNTGDIAWDANYIYVKTAAGWKRSALTTW